MSIDLTPLGGTVSVTARTLSDVDLDAANTLTDPDRVGLTPNASIVVADGVATILLPPVSWTEIRVSVTSGTAPVARWFTGSAT